MADCEFLKGWPFFNDILDDMPAVANMMKSKYCRGDNAQCARYLVRTEVGKEAVPDDLFPHEKDKAQEIIDEA